jgi:hypothetical protein
MTTRTALYYTRIICIVLAFITLAAILYYIFLPCIHAFYDNCLPPCIYCCNCKNHYNTDSSTVVPVESDNDNLENSEV